MENECSVSSSLHRSRSIGASARAGASVQVQSTAYRWSSGFCAVCAAFSSSTLVRPWTCPRARPARGPCWSGASSPRASSPTPAITVVCSSRTVPSGRAAPSCSGTSGQPGGRHHRLDPPVEPGQHVVQPGEQLHRVVEAERPGVVPHRARRRVGPQPEPGNDPGEPRPRPRGPPTAGRGSSRRPRGPACRRPSPRPAPSCSGTPTRGPGCPSPARPAAGSRPGRPSRSGRRETPGPVRPGTARAPGAARGGPRHPARRARGGQPVRGARTLPGHGRARGHERAHPARPGGRSRTLCPLGVRQPRGRPADRRPASGR